MFEIHNSSDGQYYWVLKAGNYEPLCHSETYTTKQSAQNGIEAVKRVVADAQVVDKTNLTKNLY